MAIDITTISVEMDTSSLRAGQTQLNRTAQAGTNLAKSFLGVASALGAGLGVTELARKLIDTERVTGSLNASLQVSTGSAENAKKAFAALAQLGVELPESLNDVTKAFTMMVNLGLDPSQAAIKSYSNTASAMNKSLIQMVEAVADAATGQYERLKEFGIKASAQGDKVAFTFQGTTKTVQNNADAISQYLKDLGDNNFAGSAEKKMATLDGAISNLGDSYDGLARAINSAGLGKKMADEVRAVTSAIGDLTESIESGQLEQQLDAISIQFKGFSDDATRSVEIVTAEFDFLLSYFDANKESFGGFISDAFRDMPQNIRAFIQISVVELLSLSDAAKVIGEQIARSLNPATAIQDLVSGYADVRTRLEAIANVRSDSIAQIMKERDLTTEAANQKRKDADLARTLYEIERDLGSSSIENLGKYKVAGEKITTLTKEQIKVLDDSAKKEADRVKNIDDLVVSMTREADLMGEQSKEAQTRYDIEKGILKVKGGIIGAEGQALIAAAALNDEKKKALKAEDDLLDKVMGFSKEAMKAVEDMGKEAEKQNEEISRSLTDALMRGFESGKGFAQNLKDTVKNMFKTLVIQPVIQPLMDKAAGYAQKLINKAPPIVKEIAAAASIVGSLWNNYMEKDFKELTSEFRQSKQSTGTLLGNANAKSDSINKALSEMGDNGASLLDVNHGMYQALLDIKTGISGSAAGFARQSLGGNAGADIKTGTVFNTVNLGGSIIGGFLGSLTNSISKAIYNKKTKIIDSGIQVIGSSLADALASGMVGAMNYAEVKTTKKFLGLTTSSKVKTQTSDLDDAFKIQFAKVFEGAGKALEEASKAFGAEFDASKLMIDATKLSLKGLEGDALTKEIESFFSATLDKWAGSLVEGLTQFQQVGEGAFETMVRLASQTNIFTNYAEKLLPKFNLVGMAAIEATQSVAELAGGFDRLNTNMSSYYNNFFSETEKTEAGLLNISEALATVGITMPKTRDEFRSLVEGLDLTNEAQQKQFAAMMDVNQAFAQFVPAAKDAATATTELVNTFDAIAEQQKNLSDKLFEMTANDAEKRKRELDSLLSDENRAIQQQINNVIDLNKAKEAQADIDNEAYALETQKLTLMGNTAALRERELALINPANQAKQKEIWALDDSRVAAEAAAQAQEAMAQAARDSAESAAQAQEDMAQAARDSAEEQKRLMQGVHDSISSALKSLMGESESLSAMTQSQARMTLQGALMTAKAGGSLVGYAGLEDALGAIQKQGTYSSSLESRLAMGRNIGLLSELAKYTKVDGSHANGLESVPYDGYIARLHKGERVQTANEAGNNSGLAAKVDRLIEVINSGNIAIAQNTAKGAKLLEKWDNDGQPETRSVA